MCLRLLMRLIKPTNEQLRYSNGNSWLTKKTQSIYKWMLNQLLKSYLHSAIHDTITLDDGNIKIIHEFRDIEFENELKRNGIDIRPHLLSTMLPYTVQKCKSGKWHHYFRFKDLLSVYVDDKELFVKNDSSNSVSGTIPAHIKVSSSSDIIHRNFIEVNPRPAISSKKVKRESYTSTEANRPAPFTQRKNIFGKDVMPMHRSKPAERTVEKKKAESAIIEKQGFEIDTTF